MLQQQPSAIPLTIYKEEANYMLIVIKLGKQGKEGGRGGKKQSMIE
jgi:hypothetical protein